jgi:hypothetical protein
VPVFSTHRRALTFPPRPLSEGRSFLRNVMANPVRLLAEKSGSYLDWLLEVRHSMPDVVEALVPSAYFDGSVLGTSTATARLLYNICFTCLKSRACFAHVAHFAPATFSACQRKRPVLVLHSSCAPLQRAVPWKAGGLDRIISPLNAE